MTSLLPDGHCGYSWLSMPCFNFYFLTFNSLINVLHQHLCRSLVAEV